MGYCNGRIQQDPKWPGQLRFGYAELVDVEALENGLIHLPPDRGRGGAVRLVAAREQRQASVDDGLKALERQACGLEVPFCALQLGCEPVLLLTQQGDWYSVLVVRLKQFALLFAQALDLTSGERPAVLGARAMLGEALRNQFAQQLSVFGCEPDVAPLVCDMLFHQVEWNRLLLALCSTLLPTEAEEVEVDGAMPVGRLRNAQPAAALTAEHSALQVVVVDALLLLCLVARVQDGLHASEELWWS